MSLAVSGTNVVIVMKYNAEFSVFERRLAGLGLTYASESRSSSARFAPQPANANKDSLSVRLAFTAHPAT